MAFVFSVGDASVAGANSFVTLAEYRDFFPGSLGYGDTDLTAEDDADLQRFLVFAAWALGTVPWHGETKYDEEDEYDVLQPRLPFPRYNCWVGSGAHQELEGVSTIDDETVPGVVKRAQIHLAEEERVRRGLGEPSIYRVRQDRWEALKSKRSIVGSSKVWAEPLAPREYPEVDALLRGLHGGAMAAGSGQAMAIAI